MTAQLPYGGREIADIWAKRQKPADMVLVSLVGSLREINPLVIARPENLRLALPCWPRSDDRGKCERPCRTDQPGKKGASCRKS